MKCLIALCLLLACVSATQHQQQQIFVVKPLHDQIQQQHHFVLSVMTGKDQPVIRNADVLELEFNTDWYKFTILPPNCVLEPSKKHSENLLMIYDSLDQFPDRIDMRVKVSPSNLVDQIRPPFICITHLKNRQTIFYELDKKDSQNLPATYRKVNTRPDQWPERSDRFGGL